MLCKAMLVLSSFSFFIRIYFSSASRGFSPASLLRAYFRCRFTLVHKAFTVRLLGVVAFIASSCSIFSLFYIVSISLIPFFYPFAFVFCFLLALLFAVTSIPVTFVGYIYRFLLPTNFPPPPNRDGKLLRDVEK